MHRFALVALLLALPARAEMRCDVGRSFEPGTVLLECDDPQARAVERAAYMRHAAARGDRYSRCVLCSDHVVGADPAHGDKWCAGIKALRCGEIDPGITYCRECQRVAENHPDDSYCRIARVIGCPSVR